MTFEKSPSLPNGQANTNYDVRERSVNRIDKKNSFTHDLFIDVLIFLKTDNNKPFVLKESYREKETR